MSDSLETLETELALLRRAYRSGALEVTSDGKRVKYADGADLLKRIRVVQSEIEAATTGAPLPTAGFAQFRRA